MILQEKAEREPPLGLYVHVPFCPSSCDFCAFYQEPPDAEAVGRYLDGVESELATIQWEQPVTTVFWGGGTPGMLAAPDLRRLGAAVGRHLDRAPLEWTVEMAPSTVSAARMKALREIGVTRISLGVQSFARATLEKLGRRHSPERIFRSIEIIRSAGFENLNIDLIFAIPGQSLKAWEVDLEATIAVNPEHLSTYCLTFEEDTALYARLMRGEIFRRSEEEECRFYEMAEEILCAAEYRQYEVSNFARDGMVCRHNVNTWEMHDWFGVGPAASSQRAGRRRTNIDSLDTWYCGLRDKQPVYRENVAVDPATVAVDCLVFGLRMNRGVNLGDLRKRFPQVDLSACDSFFGDLAEGGLLEFTAADTIALTARGLLLADRVGVEILERYT